ncbi:MAG TPA: DUF1036 domain-containing protein [Rhizomicrobium sp.]|nr:DUF1036 domain-containing protein [Rhizomicrobium sp.]
MRNGEGNPARQARTVFSLHIIDSLWNVLGRRAHTLLSGLALSLFAFPAHAALQLCNQTSYILYAAVAEQQSAQIATRGWTRIVPGNCANAVAEPLKAASYFVYARSAHAQGALPRVWGGQFQFCIEDAAFSLSTKVTNSACGNGAYQAAFAPVATNGAPVWTMTFTEQPGFASPDDARAAGLRRLLNDLGYQPALDARSLGNAIGRFRAHMKLPASISPDDLFTALETEAKKGSPEAGYSICNDGDGDIWAALGTKEGTDFVSRGWWQIAAGACSVAINRTLPRDVVYLFASKVGNNHLVTGPASFCVSNTPFDIRGRDRCSERGLSVAGFAATNQKGAKSFVARIGNKGLQP